MLRPTRLLTLLMSLAFLFLARGPLCAQLSSSELQAIQRETTNPVPYTAWMVTESFTGSMQDVGGFISTFNSDFTAQHLDSRFGSFRPTSVLLLPQDPDAVQVTPMLVGLTVAGPLSVQPPLQIQQIQFSRAAIHTHTGPYQDLGAVHSAMASDLPTSQHLGWPVVLQLLNDPTTVPPTAIQSTMVVQELPN